MPASCRCGRPQGRSTCSPGRTGSERESSKEERNREQTLFSVDRGAADAGEKEQRKTGHGKERGGVEFGGGMLFVRTRGEDGMVGKEE